MPSGIVAAAPSATREPAAVPGVGASGLPGGIMPLNNSTPCAGSGVRDDPPDVVGLVEPEVVDGAALVVVALGDEVLAEVGGVDGVLAVGSVDESVGEAVVEAVVEAAG